MYMDVRGQLVRSGSLTMWILGTELGSSGLAVSAFIHQVILPAQVEVLMLFHSVIHFLMATFATSMLVCWILREDMKRKPSSLS